jgi:uncharacterized protein (TIGR02246 family)
MNLEDIEQVRDLILRYTDAVNLYDVDMYGDTFAEDGIWEVEGNFKTAGREAIKKELVYRRNIFQWVYQVVQGSRVLSVDGDTAKARSWVVEYGVGSTAPIFVLGVYHDECVRRDGKWQFASRTYSPLYLGPPDLSAPLKNYPAPNRF